MVLIRDSDDQSQDGLRICEREEWERGGKKSENMCERERERSEREKREGENAGESEDELQYYYLVCIENGAN